jgi:hypothetical protein
MGGAGEELEMYLIKKKRKVDNKNRSTEILKGNGVLFSTHNNGLHLIVKSGVYKVDFWPSTGKFKVRGQNKYRRGVFNLLKVIGVSE